MRHRSPEMCAVGALAIYFFCRFHMRNEQFPSFAQSEDFFYNKVIQPMTQGKVVKKGSMGLMNADEDEHEERRAGDTANRTAAAAADILFDNRQNGGVDISGKLVAHAAAGPCISNGTVSDADRERLAQLNSRSTGSPSAPTGVKAIGYDSQRTAFRDALERADVPSAPE